MSREIKAQEFVTNPGEVTIDGLKLEMAGWMVRQPEFRSLRILARSAHPGVYAYLTAVSVVGQKWCSSVARTPLANRDEQASQSRSWVSSSEAADLLKVGPRAVQQAIARGRLKATFEDGRWRIEKEDLEHYQATRAA